MVGYFRNCHFYQEVGDNGLRKMQRTFLWICKKCSVPTQNIVIYLFNPTKYIVSKKIKSSALTKIVTES